MVTLAMIVLEILTNKYPQVLLAEGHDLCETLRSDGAHKSFRISIQIRAFRW